MKKHKLLQILPVLGLMAASCSSDSFMEPENENNVSDANVQGYLSVNIIAPGAMNTKADADPNYKDGTEKENKVTAVRFYFFDDDDKPFGIRKDPNNEGQTFCYYDWTTDADTDFAGTPNNDPGDKVEKIMQVSIPLLGDVKVGETDAKIPSKVVAILNPNEAVKNISSITKKDDLNKLVSNFKDGYTDENFVITNSVYYDKPASDIVTFDYTPITSDKIKSTLEDALKDPVKIYVERVVARLDLNFEGDGIKKVEGKDDTYETGVTFKPTDDSSTSEVVYVKFLGWTATAVPDKSYLVKTIDTGWNINFLDPDGENEPWNVPLYHRSFWASNPTGLNYSWFTYNEITGGGNVTSLGLGMDESTIYLQENANPFEAVAGSPSNPKYPTQIIVAGQLVNSDGDEVEIAEYFQEKYTVNGLKNKVAGKINLWRKGTDGKYTQITPADLDFMTKMDWANESGPDVEDTYYSYFTLNGGTDGNSAAKAETWYAYQPKGNDKEEEDYTVVAKDKINQYLYDSVNRAKIWKGGATYYYFTIEHLGNKEGFGDLGVVRNHIYDATVNSISGLGTPVWNPNEKIYPEKVDKTADNLLSAEIRILQWRIVKGNFEFSW